MPRGQHPSSRANLVDAAGGDRYAGKRLIVAAIEAALKTLEDDGEIRRFHRLGDGETTKEHHRTTWAAVKAPRIYRAMVRNMRRALLGDYSADLTPEEKADIAAQVQEMQDCVPWDGTLSQEYLDDIAIELELAEAEGATPEELAALEQELTEMYLEWMAEDHPAVCWTPEEIKVRRRELIAAAKEGKAVALEDMGTLDIAGFGKFWGCRQRQLYPHLVLKDSLDYVWLYNLGVDGGFGELPINLTDGSGYPSREHVSWNSLFTSTDDEEPLNIDHVLAVRPVWNVTVRAFFEGADEVKDYVINVFPGFVLAHVSFVYQIVQEGQYGHRYERVSVTVVKYLDMPEAQSLQAQWGRSGQIIKPSIWGESHLGAWEDAGWYVPPGNMNASGKVLNDDVKGWAFSFPRLGMDTAASEQAIAAAFPRRERVWRMVRPSGSLWADVEWKDWDEFMGGDGRLSRYYYTMTDYWQTHILPPRYKPREKVRIAAAFSPKFIEAIQLASLSEP